MSPGQEYISQHIAQREARKHQKRADMATGARLVGALPVSTYLALTERKWSSSIVNAALWASDSYDGYEAKKGRRKWRQMPRTKLSKLDPFSDKEQQYGNASAILVRALREKDMATSIVAGLFIGVSAFRDYRMAKTRALAAEHDISTDAIAINRAKTLLTAIDEAALLSPLAENQTARRVMLAGLVASAALGVVGERQFNHQVNQAIINQEALQAQGSGNPA